MLRWFACVSLVALALGCSPTADPSGGGSGGGGNSGGTAGSGAVGGAGSGGGPQGGNDAGPVPDELAGVLEPIRAQHGLPALGAAVWKGDELVAIGVTGTRKLGDPTPATTADLWHLGSDTKAMTATLIGIYVDRGEIHLNDTIGALFAGEVVDPGYTAVTIEQLLQHRGGAPGEIPADIWDAMWAAGSAPGARDAAVKALISRPPAQAVGTFVYANAGYMIAGAALERLEQPKSWEQLMQAEIFAPLGMSSCGFGAPGSPNAVDEPWGHDVTTPIMPGPDADNPPSMGPAGTVHCSLADWGKFLAVHLHGARGEGSTLISQTTLTALQTPPAGGDYAAGWAVVQRDWAGGTALTHSGSNTLWYATAWLAPARNTTLAVVTNRGDDPAGLAVDAAFGPLIDSYLP